MDERGNNISGCLWIQLHSPEIADDNRLAACDRIHFGMQQRLCDRRGRSARSGKTPSKPTLTSAKEKIILQNGEKA
jgi:hypothetical protein